jgi:hypothetical protein
LDEALRGIFNVLRLENARKKARKLRRRRAYQARFRSRVEQPTLHKYYFRGRPPPAKDLRSGLLGPSDEDIVYEDDVLPADYDWSPCATSHRLVDPIRLVLVNNPSVTGTGAIDPTGELTAKFALTWRTC